MPGAVLDHKAAAAVVLLAARAALPRLRGHGGVDGLAHARLLHADLAEVGVLRGEELLARRADGQKRRRRRRRVREDVLACNLARPVVLAAGGVGDGVPRLVDDELAAGLEVAPVVPRVRVGAEDDAAAVVHRGQVGEASARGAGRGNALVGLVGRPPGARAATAPTAWAAARAGRAAGSAARAARAGSAARSAACCPRTAGSTRGSCSPPAQTSAAPCWRRRSRTRKSPSRPGRTSIRRRGRRCGAGSA